MSMIYEDLRGRVLDLERQLRISDARVMELQTKLFRLQDTGRQPLPDEVQDELRVRAECIQRQQEEIIYLKEKLKRAREPMAAMAEKHAQVKRSLEGTIRSLLGSKR